MFTQSEVCGVTMLFIYILGTKELVFFIYVLSSLDTRNQISQLREVLGITRCRQKYDIKTYLRDVVCQSVLRIQLAFEKFHSRGVHSSEPSVYTKIMGCFEQSSDCEIPKKNSVHSSEEMYLRVPITIVFRNFSQLVETHQQPFGHGINIGGAVLCLFHAL